jgi:hypothetical protein
MSKQKGFGVIEIIIIVAVLVLIGVGGWYVWRQNATKTQEATTPATTDSTQTGGKESSLVRAARDTQVKNDLNIVASELLNYVHDNQGKYPTTDDELAQVDTLYLSDKNLRNPRTGQRYSLTFSSDYAEGVISLVKGVCRDDKKSVDEPTGPRQYATATLLGDGSAYCVDL